MAKLPRPRPLWLAEKLKAIRIDLNLSQREMLGRLGMNDAYNRSIISGYELGTKEPPLPVLLKYARVAGVSTVQPPYFTPDGKLVI
ncbi:MAG: helix-turn-helix transcriptional regulator [Chloracidobacterium sp.]|nr:helix-turn-helix transcriptional regulator [Chloracidobacterium sp.]MCO5333748.1 helix-turn-helix domain-containing protein [Pyrinomonadaceae bacterium]